MNENVNPKESRLAAFSGGQQGIGLNTATSLQSNIDPAFHPASVLNLPNMIPSVNGQSDANYEMTMPMDAMMRRSMNPAMTE